MGVRARERQCRARHAAGRGTGQGWFVDRAAQRSAGRRQDVPGFAKDAKARLPASTHFLRRMVKQDTTTALVLGRHKRAHNEHHKSGIRPSLKAGLGACHRPLVVYGVPEVFPAAPSPDCHQFPAQLRTGPSKAVDSNHQLRAVIAIFDALPPSIGVITDQDGEKKKSEHPGLLLFLRTGGRGKAGG